MEDARQLEPIQDNNRSSLRRIRRALQVFVLKIGWEFTNTLLLVASLIAFFFLASTPEVHALIAEAGKWGYLGAFLTGFFFVSTFTVAPAVVVLFSLARTFDPLTLALVASVGAAIGDFVIFKFVRDRLAQEWVPVFKRLSDTSIGRLFSSPFFAWLTPVIGALIIASPFPDEFGVGMLGIAQLESWKMLSITFVLNSVGIFVLVFAAHAATHF